MYWVLKLKTFFIAKVTLKAATLTKRAVLYIVKVLAILVVGFAHIDADNKKKQPKRRFLDKK